MIALHTCKISIYFLVLFLVPSLFYVAFSASSMALGLFFTTIFFFIFSPIRIPSINLNDQLLLLIAITSIVVHFLITLFVWHDHFLVKNLLSFWLSCFFVFCAAIFSVEIRKVEPLALVSIFKFLTLVFLFLGLFSLFCNFDFLGYEKYAKSIFPFAEPSHFAINVGLILFAAGLYMSVRQRICLISLVIFMGVLYPSIVILLISLIMIILYSTSSLPRLFFIGCLIAVVSYCFLSYSTSRNYFLERLTLVNTTENLTTLVYLQGWDEMRNALLLSKGLGVGFQNMGTLQAGEYGEIIFNLTGYYKNRDDCGFLAAKIIGEFGVLGIIFVFFYLVKLFQSVRYIVQFVRLNARCNFRIRDKYPVSLVFGHSIFIIFFIEMFARGYGYFSAGLLMLFVAFFLTTPLTGRRRLN